MPGSRPARGAWIEMIIANGRRRPKRGRAPQGARGLKLTSGKETKKKDPSRPARGAWIEIHRRHRRRDLGGVAPRKGRVD